MYLYNQTVSIPGMAPKIQQYFTLVPVCLNATAPVSGAPTQGVFDILSAFFRNVNFRQEGPSNKLIAPGSIRLLQDALTSARAGLASVPRAQDILDSSFSQQFFDMLRLIQP